MTLLPPLKHIRSFKLAKLSKLPTISALPATELPIAQLTITDPQPEPSIETALAPLDLTPQEILHEIGGRLRQWREYYGWSIEEISARTQLQPRLIHAIESGQLAILPEPVYVTGMIKRYGDCLGLDGAGIAKNLPAWQSADAKPVQTISSRTTSFVIAPRMKPLHMYLGYMIVIVGMGAGISHLINDSVKPKSAILLPAVVTKPQSAIPSPTTPLPIVKIGITVKQPAWAQIGIDGTTKFTGNLQVGNQLNWEATKQITINTNNAGALILSRDHQSPQPVGKLGEKQQVTIKIGK